MQVVIKIYADKLIDQIYEWKWELCVYTQVESQKKL